MPGHCPLPGPLCGLWGPAVRDPGEAWCLRGSEDLPDSRLGEVLSVLWEDLRAACGSLGGATPRVGGGAVQRGKCWSAGKEVGLG